MADDVLVLTNRDAEGLLSMEECIDVVEEAFREMGQGVARCIPRSRIYLPQSEGQYYWYNNIPGVAPGFNTMALRIDSAQVQIHRVNGQLRMDFPGDYAGFVLLFHLDTRELYGIVHDHALSPLRVAATSAVASRLLCRPQPRVMGLFGAGEQARAQLRAHVAVFPSLQRIKLYVTSAGRRRDAAEDLSRLAGVEVEPVEEPRRAVEGCDLVTTATSSSQPVFAGEWLQAGQHVNTMIGCDFFIKRQEIDDETVGRADFIVVNYREQARADAQPEITGPIRKGHLAWTEVYELGELLAGKAPGRRSPGEITLHDNNTGMGIQFAAAGARLIENARKAGVGTRLPADLFMTRRGAGVYAP